MQTQSVASNIISLDSVRAKRQQPALTRIEDYWDTIRGNRLMPTRADIDPRDLQGVLANTFVLERIAPGLARFRVSGSHLTDLLGMEARGMPISAIFEPQARQELGEAVEAVFSEPAVVQMSLGCRGGIGRPPLTGGLVLLPLRAADEASTRALGALVMTGPTGRSPRRPEIRGQTRRTLVGYADPTVVRLPTDRD
jgi:hypothetical protein